ncbi:hypothetical protein [Cetobacterium sp.]|uniref:hypothetical protein n=1 Tax=Cetobacterium sp. TaxID=2071632 RepID=UPI003F406489
MKKLKLNSVFYFSWGGITLTSDYPTIEADEELIAKMQKFIDNGYLKIVNGDNEIDEIVEDIIKECTDETGDKYDFIPDVSEIITVKTERVPVYSKEDLEKMNRKELLALAKKMELSHAKNISVKDLENLIYDNQ